MGQPPAPRPQPLLVALARSLRPSQWVKNGLVFGGLIFSRSLLNPAAVGLSLAAFALFCLASSGVYLLNDLRDVEEDRRHPVKRLRPVAAGTLPTGLATAVMVVLLLVPAGAGFALRPEFGGVLVAYIGLNVAYTFGLKRLVIVDVMAIAAGFVLRAVGGAVVVGVEPSSWLILCTMTLALLVGFGKRRHELALLEGSAGSHRANLADYSLPLLDLMMGVTATAAVMTYALYTMARETVERFGTTRLVLSTPWVLYGVFRYLYLVHRRNGGGDPSRLFVTDLPTLVNGLMWVGVVCLLIYGPWR